MHFSGAEKPGKYSKTPFRLRRSIYAHFFGAGEVLIYTYLVPERPEKPDKDLYTPGLSGAAEVYLNTSPAPEKPRKLPTTARKLYRSFTRSAQATVSKGLAHGSYVAARAGVGATSLRLKVIDSTNAPPRPTFVLPSGYF